MKVEINKDGKLILDVYELVENLSKEDVEKFADALMFRSEVIKQVGNLIITGWNDMSSCPTHHRWSADKYPSQLDLTVREVAEKSSEIAAEEIARLKKGFDVVVEQNKKLEEENRQLHWLKHCQESRY